MALKFIDELNNTVNQLWASVPTYRASIPPKIEIDNSTPIYTPTVENISMPTNTQYASLGINGLISNLDSMRGLQLPDIAPSEPIGLRLTASAPVAQVMTETQNAGSQVDADIAALQRTINNQTAQIQAIEDARLKKAAQQNAFSAVTHIGSTIIGGLEMNEYADEVAATKDQYEIQKKIIDTNIQNSEALLMERYRESMADLDAITASKNVDPTSGAIQGIKEKGAMDMGKDFAIQRSNAEIQKLALDLDYARSNRIAQRQRRNYWESASWDIAKTGINYLIGG